MSIVSKRVPFPYVYHLKSLVVSLFLLLWGLGLGLRFRFKIEPSGFKMWSADKWRHRHEKCHDDVNSCNISDWLD